MKKNTGMIAVVTVLLAVFGVSNLPKKGNEASPSTSAVGETKNSLRLKTEKNAQSDACEELRKHIEPFVTDPTKWHLAESCSGAPRLRTKDQRNEEPKPLLVDDKLRVIIATAPNPLSTHLPLLFDRIVEVIQQAAQDEKYSYDSSWFPWDMGNDYLFLDDQHRAEEERESLQLEPGVITFRHALSDDANESPYSGGLIVFLVAEQPTGGIDGQEFENALDWIDSLGALTPERQLRILGPTFSGSLPSLKKALASPRLIPFACKSAIQISSGSVSSEKSYGWFQAFLHGLGLGNFSTFMEGDSITLDRFAAYVQKQGYSLKRVAFLSEDETAFGSQPSADEDRGQSSDNSRENKKEKPDSDDHPIYVYYPRDIATLRSAYEQQSILNSGKAATSNSPSSSLRGDLSEPANSQHDTVRTYGGQLNPLAQESLLVNITNILSERHVQFVIIRSTNSLDQIFLAQFLRRALPEARVVIDGADLLFRRGAEGSSLRGVMTVSTYPLLVWQQDWSPSVLLKGNGSYRVFGQDVSEGVYIAARQLLNLPGNPIVPIGNYAPPSWVPNDTDTRSDHPRTWVSVIGHHQFWPVAVLNSSEEITKTLPTLSDGDKTPLHISAELKVLLLLGAVWSVLHLLWCLRGSVVPTTAAFRLACFAPLTRKQHPFLVAIGSLFPAFAAVVTAASTGLLSWSWNPGRELALASWVIGMVAASIYACLGNYRLPVASGSSSPHASRSKWQLIAGTSAIVALALFCGLYFYLVHNLNDENKIPLYWRSSHLLSGVSPLLPQLFLLVGLYVWFWFNLRGLALFGDDRPLLPKDADLPASDDVLRKPMMPMFSHEGAEKPLEKYAVALGKRHLRALAVMIPLSVGVFAMALEGISVRTLGERAFGIEIFFWLSLCIALVLADTVHIWLIWKNLHSLLNYLDRLALRRTLAALRGMSWGSVWRMSGNTLEERYRVISRQFESLRHLDNCLKQWAVENDSPEKQAEELYRKEQLMDRISVCQKKGKAFADWYVALHHHPSYNIAPLREFQEELAATAGSVLKNLLLPAWRNETVSLIFDRKGTHLEKDEPSRIVFSPENIPAHVLAGEEFAVLPYLAFIQNVMGRIRTIVLGSLFLFVATTLAMSSYPFDPLPTLGAVFLGVFAITGGVVVLVFAQMNRDSTLSYITNTNPGELGGHFWFQLLTFGVGPLLGLLTTLFPSLTDFVSSWLQPSVEALK
jgi:hypothetical protein